MQSVCINNQGLAVKEYQGQRVVTFKDIDLVHQRPEGTARKRFNDNRKHFIDGEDYFLAKPDISQMSEKRTFRIPPRGITLITESGYLMLVKSFTDDLAWTVQRQLVKTYFRAKASNHPDSPWFIKWYNGKPIITLHDFTALTGIELIGRKPFFRPEKFVGGLDFNGLGQGPLRIQFEQENGVHYEEETFMYLHPVGLRKVLNILENEKAISSEMIKELEQGMNLAQNQNKPKEIENRTKEISLPSAFKFTVTVDTTQNLCQVK